MINNIQFLRGYAVILVIFVHLDLLLEKLDLQPFGYAGVDLFFVISGFIMVYICKDKKPKPFDFMIKRIIRIVPIYWLSTLFVFAVALFAPQLMNSTSADFGQLLKSLLFIPFEKSDGNFYPTLFVGWTLNYEMFFYALFAIGLFLPNTKLAALFTLSALVAVVTLPNWVGLNSQILEFYSNPIIINFGLGMIVGLLYDRLPKTYNKLALFLLSSVALTCLALIIPTDNHPSLNSLLCTILVATAVALEKAGFVIKFRPARWVGDASYVIYLSHVFITQAAQKILLPRMHELGDFFTIAVILITLLGCVIAGLVIHWLVEKPLTQALNSKRG